MSCENWRHNINYRYTKDIFKTKSDYVWTGLYNRIAYLCATLNRIQFAGCNPIVTTCRRPFIVGLYWKYQHNPFRTWYVDLALITNEYVNRNSIPQCKYLKILLTFWFLGHKSYSYSKKQVKEMVWFKPFGSLLLLDIKLHRRHTTEYICQVFYMFNAFT